MNSILLGQAEAGPQSLLLSRANRHGIVAGSTGTGKTVTLQTLAKAFSDAGVPVFAADIKGDVSTIAKVAPTKFWDLYGTSGQTIRISVADMGPMLFSCLLELNEVQYGIINIMFELAKADNKPLNTIADVSSLLRYINQNTCSISNRYGHVKASTVGTIQRKLLILKTNQTADLFGPTNFKLGDLIQRQGSAGVINILSSQRLIEDPQMYTIFLFWLLNELFRQLPEVGDLEKPKLVFFFDEAHLLFRDAPKMFVSKVEQIVRLIRSKGVGVYFVTQNPADLPEQILAQLSNRIQHALRAYTPAEQKGLRAASQSFRPNPAFDTAEAIQQLGIGEALVSVLDEQGVPSQVQKTKIGAVKIPAAPALNTVVSAPAINSSVNLDLMLPKNEGLKTFVVQETPKAPAKIIQVTKQRSSFGHFIKKCVSLAACVMVFWSLPIAVSFSFAFAG